MRFATCIGAMVVAMIVTATVGFGAGLTGDEILQQVDDQGIHGSLVTRIRFDSSYADGSTTYNVFFGVSTNPIDGPQKSLMYFESPDNVTGMAFLSITPVEGDNRMWLYLPALGSPKEIVAEQRKQSFAGSALSYEDVGGHSFAEKYTAELIREEVLQIESKSYDCYVLAMTARPDADADYATVQAWVDKIDFQVLKREGYASDGTLERTVEITTLGEFEGSIVAAELLGTNLADGSTTTVTFLKRTRPETSILDSVFDPANLPSFNPATYGL